MKSDETQSLSLFLQSQITYNVHIKKFCGKILCTTDEKAVIISTNRGYMLKKPTGVFQVSHTDEQDGKSLKLIV